MTLAYDSEGDGPLVVLLHGFPESRMSWRKQLPALAAAGFRAVAPDLRGYGDSPKPRGIDDYRVPPLVDDVARLIESQGGSCVLVGHDWGALVAWFLAMTRPELVRRLVIVNVAHPAAFVREIHRSWRQRLRASYQLFFQLPWIPELFWRAFGKMLLRRMGRFTREQIDAYARQWSAPMFHYYRAMRRTRGELRKLIRRIDVPVLVIYGTREPVMLPAAFEHWEEWVTDVRVEKIEGAGHFAQHDAPERVNELLVGFARL